MHFNYKYLFFEIHILKKGTKSLKKGSFWQKRENFLKSPLGTKRCRRDLFVTTSPGHPLIATSLVCQHLIKISSILHCPIFIFYIDVRSRPMEGVLLHNLNPFSSAIFLHTLDDILLLFFCKINTCFE